MLTYQTHPEEVKTMQDIINSGRFFSVTFIKGDGTIRHVSGKKRIYKSDSPASEKRGKYNRLEKNILLIWDTNKTYKDKETGEIKRGAYIQARIDRILFFKSGTFTKDYTQENIEAIEKANITQDQIDNAMMKTNMSSMISEEIEKILQEYNQNFFRIAELPRLLKIKFKNELSDNDIQDYANAFIEQYKKLGYNDEKMLPYLRQLLGVEVFPVTHGKFSFQPVS